MVHNDGVQNQQVELAYSNTYFPYQKFDAFTKNLLLSNEQ